MSAVRRAASSSSGRLDGQAEGEAPPSPAPSPTALHAVPPHQRDPRHVPPPRELDDAVEQGARLGLVADDAPAHAIALEAPCQRIKTHDDVRFTQCGQRLRQMRRRLGSGASVYGASRSLLCSALRLLAFFVTALLSADIVLTIARMENILQCCLWCVKCTATKRLLACSLFRPAGRLV